MLEAMLWFSFFASQALMLRAIVDRSWMLMGIAALGSVAFSIISMFSIGPYVFLLTCLQLAAVVAARPHLSLLATVTTILMGTLVWILIVPVQMSGYEWVGGFGVYQAVGLTGLLLALLPFGRLREVLASIGARRQE